ncbi:MAG: DUF2851 family protein, partial [Bacteroidales bacterium]|nr:DUF2851 family protein [Bacteroidales bacterium]
AAMKEEFLHYLWKYSLYDPDKLFDNEGNKITVISPGEYNRDSGPDFFNARLIIGKTEWAGNVEIHTQSSYFDTHGHNLDPAYDNVILHVVAVNDKKVFNSKGEELNTSELAFDLSLYDKYLDLVNNPYVIACQQELPKLDQFFIRHWLGALLIERLNDKSGQIMKIFTETGNDWEETFYRLLARYFGFRVNTEPFEMMANALPFKIIRKHSDNLLQVEALLFGTAGMLDEALFREALKDDYYRDLTREFRILSVKYSLKPIHGWLWKFARLRPANFPTLRISQLAVMLSNTGGLFAKIIEADKIADLRDLFEVTASGYWNDHFVFGKQSRLSPKKTGAQATDILLINAVIPALFFYGRTHDSHYICEKAVSFLEEIRSESNSIIEDWNLAGIYSESAFYSQALIHLRSNYCRKRRCLDCRIGFRLISAGENLKRNEQLILEP